MNDQLSTSFEEKPFELNAWALLTAIGAVRILKDILQDLFIQNPSQTNLLIDVPLLTVFLLLLFLILKNKITTVPLWVGVVLLLLTSWSFIRLGGVEGSSEYNFMALGVMFTLCYRGWNLTLILAALFTIIVLANIDQLLHGKITSALFQSATNSHDSFYTTLIVVGVVLLYFKQLLKEETSKVRHLRRLMTIRHSLIRKQHEELLQQKSILSEATRRLSQDVQQYDDVIKEQNKAISDYVYLSTQNLKLSMARLKSVPGSYADAEGFTGRLTEQIDQLNVVVANLIDDLEKPDHDHVN
jgi:hypothetical protein